MGYGEDFASRCDDDDEPHRCEHKLLHTGHIFDQGPDAKPAVAVEKDLAEKQAFDSKWRDPVTGEMRVDDNGQAIPNG